MLEATQLTRTDQSCHPGPLMCMCNLREAGWTTHVEFSDGWMLDVFKAHASPPTRIPFISPFLVTAAGSPVDYGFTGFLLFPQP